MADSKITQLNANTAPIYTDIFPMVDDPGGSPETQKITYSNVFSNIPFLCFGPAVEYTISSAEIDLKGTAGNHTFIRIDTESDAASDDLETISNGTDGEIIICRPENDARTVVMKDAVDNLSLAGGDFSMDSYNDIIILIYDDTLSVWLEISRSNNA